MKKMTKGAIVTGLGVALLLGGGGTLAVWNQTAASEAGQIVSGDLDLEADTGKWTSSISGPIPEISDYKVVPGETLTYEQPLKVTLDGDNLTATLALQGVAENKGFTGDNVTVGQPIISKNGSALGAANFLTEADSGAEIVASTSFAFDLDTDGRDSTNATYDFSGIGYFLEQIAPTGN